MRHNVPGLGEVGFIVGLARWANPPRLARVSSGLLLKAWQPIRVAAVQS